MIQKVRNLITITCEKIDFTTASAMEVYVEQGLHKFAYPLEATAEHEAQFEMPKRDAMKLAATSVKMQFAATDENGAPVVSDVITVPVMQLLKVDGYGN